MPVVLRKRAHRCPVAAFQKMISGKYKLRILWDIKDGPLRYGEIKSGLLRGVEGTQEIVPRVLSRELKALVQSGLVVRQGLRRGAAQGGISPHADRPELHPGHR